MAIKTLIEKKLLKSVHDISAGGIIVALSEMCISGNIGAKIKIPVKNISNHEYLFGEDQSRYVIEISEENKEKVLKFLEKNSIYFELIGKTQEKILNIGKEININLEDLNELNSYWFKNYFKVK